MRALLKQQAFCLGAALILSGCQGRTFSPTEENQKAAHRWITQSLKEVDAKKIDDAVMDLGNAVKIYPQEVESYLLLAQIFLRANRADQAVETLQYAANLFPDNGTVFYLLAIADSAAGRKSEAIAACQFCIKLFGQYGADEEVYRNSMFIAEMLLQVLRTGVSPHI